MQMLLVERMSERFKTATATFSDKKNPVIFFNKKSRKMLKKLGVTKFVINAFDNRIELTPEQGEGGTGEFIKTLKKTLRAKPQKRERPARPDSPAFAIIEPSDNRPGKYKMRFNKTAFGMLKTLNSPRFAIKVYDETLIELIPHPQGFLLTTSHSNHTMYAPLEQTIVSNRYQAGLINNKLVLLREE